MVIEEELKKYEEFFKIPSVSIEKTGTLEAVEWLTNQFKKMNAQSIDVWDDFGEFPVVIGRFEGMSDRTILIYNHYDVQTIGDLKAWETDPFMPVIKEEKLYCRGSSDCKGEIIARLMVIDKLQKEGELPCNIIFLIEGEEEIGSPNLSNYIKKYSKELQADVCLWECGWKNEKEQVEISCGVKGLLSFELEVTTASSPIHSSYANIFPNAMHRLSNGISLLINENNEILVPDFYDDILTLTLAEKEVFSKLSVDFEKMKYEFGIDKKWNCSKIIDRLYNQPTLNVSHIDLGDKFAYNSIPNQATAKIDCRFLPGQNPEKLLELIKKRLAQHGLSDIKIKNVNYEDAYRSNIEDENVTSLLSCAKKIYGTDKVKLIPNFAGGGPMSLFGNILKIPIVSLGVSYMGSNVHSPNEHIRLNDLSDNIACLTDWFSFHI